MSSNKYENLSTQQIRYIKHWIDNCPTSIIDEHIIYDWLNNMIVNPIDFKGRFDEPKKKEGTKSLTNLKYSIDTLESYYKNKFEDELNSINKDLKKEISKLKDRERKSPIGSGSVLVGILALDTFERATDTKVTLTNAREGAFNSFLILYFSIKDPDYNQDSHETLIARCIEGRKRIEDYISKAIDQDRVLYETEEEQLPDGRIIQTKKITIKSPTTNEGKD